MSTPAIFNTEDLVLQLSQFQNVPVYVENKNNQGGHLIELVPIKDEDGKVIGLWLLPYGTQLLIEMHDEGLMPDEEHDEDEDP